MTNSEPLQRPKEEYEDIIKKISMASSAVGIDAQYTHAIIITYLQQISERLDRLEEKLKIQKWYIRISPFRRDKGEEMKNSFLSWAIIIGIVIVIAIGFGYQNNRNAVPWSEIFPEEKSASTAMDYEYVDQSATAEKNAPAAEKAKIAAAPVQKTTAAVVQKTTTPAAAATTPAVSQAAQNTGTLLENIIYTIQIASSKDKAQADKKLKEVQAKGYSPYISERNLGDKGIWYRINVGQFKTKAEAEDTLNKVKADYKDSFIISPKKKWDNFSFIL